MGAGVGATRHRLPAQRLDDGQGAHQLGLERQAEALAVAEHDAKLSLE